jgi:hypothetical protein
MNKIIIFFLLFIACSCTRVPQQIEPQLCYTVQDRYLKQLPAPFPSLSSEERREDWGKEYLIGQHFARELDLYRAITAFRRAKILASQDLRERHLEIDYEILLCYYLGKRYEEVDIAFTQSNLSQVNTDFPAYRDLLIILYETYQNLGCEEKVQQILELMNQVDPKIHEGLLLSTLLQKADFCNLENWGCNSPFAPCVSQVLTCYNQGKKSIATAQWLNALIPGSGYLYLGQRQTALTAFLVNGLFIAATVQFFRHGYTAAGAITASFEAGWYFGGIAGAGYEAKLYNERLYEKCTTPLMNRNGLFPVFMLQYSF